MIKIKLKQRDYSEIIKFDTWILVPELELKLHGVNWLLTTESVIEQLKIAKPSQKMKTIVFSDPHGNLPDIIEEFDLLLIAGDICPTKTCDYQKRWIHNIFFKWIESLPFKDEFSRVVFIAGNHDFYMEKFHFELIEDINSKLSNRAVYLKNSTYNHIHSDESKYIIFGTPYCIPYGDWAFMRPNDELCNFYNEMPYNADIVISHDSISNNGLAIDYYQTDVGNEYLEKEIITKKPNYYFCGHFHTGDHNLKKIKNTETLGANVSLLNDSYTTVYSPLVIEI